MDTSGTIMMLATALGAGIAVGILTLVGSLMFILPVSWVMNRFVYHNTLMRILLGWAAGASSVFSFFVIVAGSLLGFFGKPYYFGLFPTFMSRGDSAPVGWMAPFIRIWNAVSHPFRLRMENEAEDKAALLKTMEAFLIPEDSVKMDPDAAKAAAGALYQLSGRRYVPHLPIYQDAVCEPFFEATRIAGSQSEASWSQMMKQLEATKVGDLLIAHLGAEVPVEAPRA